MYIASVDTTDRYKKSVKLLSNGKELASRFGDIDVVSSIRDLLEENNLKPKEIDEYVCNPGPGSFTGIKVGVTIVNVLNWVLGKRKIAELTVPNYGREPNITPRRKGKNEPSLI